VDSPHRYAIHCFSKPPFLDDEDEDSASNSATGGFEAPAIPEIVGSDTPVVSRSPTDNGEPGGGQNENAEDEGMSGSPPRPETEPVVAPLTVTEALAIHDAAQQRRKTEAPSDDVSMIVNMDEQSVREDESAPPTPMRATSSLQGDFRKENGGVVPTPVQPNKKETNRPTTEDAVDKPAGEKQEASKEVGSTGQDTSSSGVKATRRFVSLLPKKKKKKKVTKEHRNM
jgi:hypothetical protein